MWHSLCVRQIVPCSCRLYLIMGDTLETYRARIGCHYVRHSKVKGLEYLTVFDFFVILSTLLLKCGDVELNPGPSSDSSISSPNTSNLASSISSSSIPDTPTYSDAVIRDKFSIVHYNIQSLRSKTDLIEAELNNFDVICLKKHG